MKYGGRIDGMTAPTNSERIIGDIRAGWKSLGFTTRMYWSDSDGNRTAHRTYARCACAIGAAAFAAGYSHPLAYAYHLPISLVDRITKANDSVDMTKYTDEQAKVIALENIKVAIEKWEAGL
jgi:hypothetical protein